MNPLTVPASTVMTALAGAITTIIVWGLQLWAKVEVPVEVATAITTVASVLACHYTTDAPSSNAQT